MSSEADLQSRIDKLYQTESYLDAYRQHTDLRVQQDPHAAVGGLWEEIGRLQFVFLLRQGLQAHHRLLDIGCGTLRGGRHFIRYLQPRHYFGFDISAAAIDYGGKLVVEEGLTEQLPQLMHSAGQNLQFAEFRGEQFDYLLAQSVFTHLKPEHIGECFQHIGQLMTMSSQFFFTYNRSSDLQQSGIKDFSQPFEFYQQLAQRYDFAVSDCSEDYPHPRGMNMVRLRLKTVQITN